MGASIAYVAPERNNGCCASQQQIVVAFCSNRAIISLDPTRVYAHEQEHEMEHKIRMMKRLEEIRQIMDRMARRKASMYRGSKKAVRS